MDATVSTGTEDSVWGGGNQPLGASYGKMMMWFFIMSDASTFSGFLVAYGFSRFKFIEQWPIADEVFTHFPFLHGVEAPMYYVAFMTFILIMSSVTMVLAVNYGHKMQKNQVILWMSLTILGGIAFLGSQAWEWGHFIHGERGAINTTTLEVVHIAKDNELSSVYELVGVDAHHGHHEITLDDVVKNLEEKQEYSVRLANRENMSNQASIEYINKNGTEVITGANLHNNEYGHYRFSRIPCF